MQRSGLMETPVEPRHVPDAQADKRALTESVAYALWQERKRRSLPDDPEADWYHAEELITELWNHRPPEMN
jgi:hypothetical protein